MFSAAPEHSSVSVAAHSQFQVDPLAPLPLQQLHSYYWSIRPSTELCYCRAYEVCSLVTSRFTSPLKFPRFQLIACSQVTPPVRRMLLRQFRVTAQLCPRLTDSLRFSTAVSFSTGHRKFTCVRLLWYSHDGSSRLFQRRSPPRHFRASAAAGCLEPPPRGRLRWTFHHQSSYFRGTI